MECRPGCGACCIAPSISSPLPSSPEGKPAGVACPHLDGANRCLLFESPSRPVVCGRFKPCREVCGDTREEALANLAELEALT
ncbi:YkgJ family cysteine cluster protein [Motiliproteus sp. SC1-56]|uniref:YkgJ family cysteine cluster protein n=1 Tax=Motiliproteus sp. SC1-56 TaxID=2799565 RepID=UPI001F5C4820|nr:YkgJ family cysteine cluster protein [Motiliproteus sp. SC1-56]